MTPDTSALSIYSPLEPPNPLVESLMLMHGISPVLVWENPTYITPHLAKEPTKKLKEMGRILGACIQRFSARLQRLILVPGENSQGQRLQKQVPGLPTSPKWPWTPPYPSWTSLYISVQCYQQALCKCRILCCIVSKSPQLVLLMTLF